MTERISVRKTKGIQVTVTEDSQIKIRKWSAYFGQHMGEFLVQTTLQRIAELEKDKNCISLLEDIKRILEKKDNKKTKKNKDIKQS